MNDENFKIITESLLKETTNTLNAFNKFIVENNVPRTNYETYVFLICIQISCEKAIEKLNKDNTDIIKSIYVLSEILLRKNIDNIFISEKVKE